MSFDHYQVIKYTVLNRMVSKRNVTYQEIRHLQEEMDTLKAVISSKQKRLRELNQRINLHQQRFSQIRLVFAQPAWRVQSNASTANVLLTCLNQERPQLHCLQGDKQ